MAHYGAFENINTSICPEDWEEQISLQPFYQPAIVGRPAAFNSANYPTPVLENRTSSAPSADLPHSFEHFNPGQTTLPQNGEENRREIHSPDLPKVKRFLLGPEYNEDTNILNGSTISRDINLENPEEEEEEEVEDPFSTAEQPTQDNGWDLVWNMIGERKKDADENANVMPDVEEESEESAYDEDSEDDDRHSFGSSVPSELAHHIQASFSSEEEDFNPDDYPVLHSEHSVCKPEMQQFPSFLPSLRPKGFEMLRRRNVIIDPTKDVIEPGTVAVVTTRNPEEMPEFLKADWKDFSRMMVTGVPKDDVQKIAKQMGDLNVREDIKNSQKDYFHGSYYSLKDYQGANELWNFGR